MVLREKYCFIRDDVNLIVEVNEDNGSQNLLLEKIDIQTGLTEYSEMKLNYTKHFF